MRRTLLRSPAFARDLRTWLKSHPDAAASIEASLEQLSADAAPPSLRTPKLRGPLAGDWACSVGYDLRVAVKEVGRTIARLPTRPEKRIT